MRIVKDSHGVEWGEIYGSPNGPRIRCTPPHHSANAGQLVEIEDIHPDLIDSKESLVAWLRHIADMLDACEEYVPLIEEEA